jgi:hypothetical protein
MRRRFNLWSLITGIFKPLLFQGSQRPLAFRRVADNATVRGRNYDLEISENPIRDYEKARELIEMCEWCPEVGKAIQEIISSALSSADGDDQGFTLKRYIYDDQGNIIGQAIDDEVYGISMACLERALPISTVAMILERLLSYGDSFAELCLDDRGGRVEGLMLLPTWEMFRVEVQGAVERFDQRRRLWEESPEITFNPAKMVHWRYRRKNLYGRSLFNESVQDWGNLRRATDSLTLAVEAVGINPNVHMMPEDSDQEYLTAYREGHEARQMEGVITDIYMMPGGKVEKLAQQNPDVKALADNVLFWRSRIIMSSGVPPYLMGLPALGAKEIAGQPALGYARHVNWVRASLTEGIMQLLYTELALKGIDPARWRGKLRVLYPRIAVNIFQGQGADNLAEDQSGELDTEIEEAA